MRPHRAAHEPAARPVEREGPAIDLARHLGVLDPLDHSTLTAGDDSCSRFNVMNQQLEPLPFFAEKMPRSPGPSYGGAASPPPAQMYFWFAFEFLSVTARIEALTAKRPQWHDLRRRIASVRACVANVVARCANDVVHVRALLRGGH